jgi:outer membrane PBP1 activator LpoA protein
MTTKNLTKTYYWLGLSGPFLISVLLSLSVLLTACSHTYLEKNAANTKKTPQRIALLLPLTGNLGTKAQSIRNGFFAASYEAKQQNPTQDPTLMVYDTHQDSIATLYRRALSEGADVVVGPLTKAEVQALANTGSVTVPTLALNNLEYNSAPKPNLYQFGLSPDDEAQQAANRAWKAGYRRALIIAPANTWGQGIVHSYEKRWQSQGGIIINQVAYNETDLNQQIHAALQNKNIDVIFLLALPNQGLQIQAILKAEAGWIPVYATSAIYNGSLGSANNTLDGIFFCDMPWILTDPGPTPRLQTMRERIMRIWPDSYAKYPRLYALGIDAYYLATHLDQIQNSSVPGATGVLSLGPYQQVYRRLEWAQIQDGKPRPL